MKRKIVGLIPTRLNSSRLPNKALLEIQNIPLIIHTYKRAKLSKKIDEVYICCDDEKIYKTANKYRAKCIMTSRHHTNGTERIGEAYKTLNQRYDLIVDIQGDEPLISPIHIDQVIEEHIKNYDYTDIILPTLLSDQKNNTNIVKVVCDKKNYVLYLSRSNIPFEFKKNVKKFKKHLSIISFKPDALEIFCKSEKTTLESIEDIELLRALELGLKIKTINLKGDSFSVDVKEDYIKASKFILSDKYLKLYKV
jgi:3-deoxy-manno-octulosonate cytidylyltransferase (CMP-KDO synthetase)